MGEPPFSTLGFIGIICVASVKQLAKAFNPSNNKQVADKLCLPIWPSQ